MDTLVVELTEAPAVAQFVDEDAELLAACARGRTLAFHQLVEKYKRRAYYVALGLVGSSDDAWDLSQEAFIRIWKGRKGFDPARPFWPWFYAILANLCKNCLRDRDVRVRHAEGIRRMEEGRCDPAGNPEAILQETETQQEVWAAIEKLPFKFREIIVLRHFQEMPYDAIARQLGIPEGSVMSRLYYARKKLREILENPNNEG
jgi:RNA polymerase sigma-70 factor (ECF subfamily)